MWPGSVLLALLRAGTPEEPGDLPQQDPWKKNLAGVRAEGLDQRGRNEDNVLERLQLWFSYLSLSVPFPEPRELGQHMSNSNGKNTNSVVHGDSSALGLNVNVGCVQVRGLGEFPWENKERRLRNYYVYTCIKGYFVVRVRKSVKHIQILTLFKTENIGIPNQTKKKQKERKQVPVIHKFQVYEYLWLHILSMNPYYMSPHPKNIY